MTSPVSVYRIFRRGDGQPAEMRPVVVAMVMVAACVCGLGLYRAHSQHAVLRDGYEISRRTEQVRRLRETRRELELEYAALAAPDRIRRLATALGMEQVTPDRIRVVRRPGVASSEPVVPRVP